MIGLVAKHPLTKISGLTLPPLSAECPPGEIRGLFPGCRFTFERITLAPPLARRLAPLSRGLCTFLESLKIFNTHYLAAIRRGE